MFWNGLRRLREGEEINQRVESSIKQLFLLFHTESQDRIYL